jgi:hypothetical protein
MPVTYNSTTLTIEANNSYYYHVSRIILVFYIEIPKMPNLNPSDWPALPNTPLQDQIAPIVWPTFSPIIVPGFSLNVILHPTHIPSFQSTQLPIPLI